MSTPANTGSAADKVVTLTQAEFDTLKKRVKDNRDQALASQQTVAELSKQQDVLLSKLASPALATASLSAEKRQELDELKYSDPDKWLVEMNGLGATSQAALNSTLEEARLLAGQEVKKVTQQEAIADFNKSNPSITMDMLQNEVPFGLKNKFDNGEIDVQTFLGEADSFFKADKTKKKPDLLNQETLGTVGGAGKASSNAQSNQAATNYEKAIF